MIPYGKSFEDKVGPGQYFAAPEKYKDWAMPNKGVELYYAHAKCMANFFAWHKVMREKTNQIEKTFMHPSMEAGFGAFFGVVAAAGPYNSPERDATIVGLLKDPMVNGMAQQMSMSPSTAKGYLEMGIDFISTCAPQAFPKEFTAKSQLSKMEKQGEEMSKYCCEINFYLSGIPEFFALNHPNAQVDNAFYWRDDAGNVQAGLLDWQGIAHGNMPTCLGNGWIGAEPDMMNEHEGALTKLFVDEYEKASAFRFDCDDLLMGIKLTQCSVFFGTLANVGQLLMICKRDKWKEMTGRTDPKIDENFLLRCYFVQIELWLRMWGLNNCPYNYFQKWMKRVKLPTK